MDLRIVAVETSANVDHAARFAGSLPGVDPPLEIPPVFQVGCSRLGKYSVIPLVRVEHHLGIVAYVMFVAFEQTERKITHIYPVFPVSQIIQRLPQPWGGLAGTDLNLVQALDYFRLIVLSPFIMRIEVDEIDYTRADLPVIVHGQFRQVLVIVLCKSAVNPDEATGFVKESGGLVHFVPCAVNLKNLVLLLLVAMNGKQPFRAPGIRQFFDLFDSQAIG